MKKIIFIFLVLFFLISGFWIFSSVFFPTTNPLNVIMYFCESIFTPHKIMKQKVTAFLPYWRIADSKYARFDLLSAINYFSLNIDKDGNFIKVNGNQTDPGWLVWESKDLKDLIAKTQISGGKFLVTIASQRNKTIESLLTNKNARLNLINNIVQLVNSRRLNGVTLDFEYDGKPDEKYKSEFTDFAQNLSLALKKQSSDITLSLTLMPLEERMPGLFDLPKLVSVFDDFIGMSYDYYSQTSSIAGPVAPMNGFKENKFFFDVTTTYADYKKIVPVNKILMGIPYYGTDWAVEDGKKIQSAVLPPDNPNNYAAVLSYARMREDKDLKPDQCTWDEFALEKWCWYIDDKKIQHQVWLEDNRSIQDKFAFAKMNNFSGIAIWTLGYDKNYPDLWNMIENEFTQKSKQ